MSVLSEPVNVELVARRHAAAASDALLALLRLHHYDIAPATVSSPVETRPEPIEIKVSIVDLIHAAEGHDVELEPAPQKPVLIDDIIREVCAFYSFSKLDLLAHRRTRRVCQARQVAMYLCRVLTMRTLPEIGRLMGNRDHTTILHGFEKIASLRETDSNLDGEVKIILHRLSQKSAQMELAA